MKPGTIGMVALLTAGYTQGCSTEATTGPLAELVGAWTVVQLEYANQVDPSEVVNMLTLGRTATFSVTGEGDWTLIVIIPNPVRYDIDTGTLTVRGDTLFMTQDGAAEAVAVAMDRSGDTLTLETDDAEYDFDSDGTPEPAYFTMVMRR